MTDYIKREDAIAEFTTNGSATVYGIDKCKAIISRLQLVPAADVVEVVRCKDCKWRNKKWYQDKRRKEGGYYSIGCNNDYIAERVYGLAGDDDYCSYGERAEA